MIWLTRSHSNRYFSELYIGHTIPELWDLSENERNMASSEHALLPMYDKIRVRYSSSVYHLRQKRKSVP